MSKWTVRIIIVDALGKRPKEVIERFDDEDAEMVLKLCQVDGGQIEYDGYNACVYKPIADPIKRLLTYRVELYGKVDQ